MNLLYGDLIVVELSSLVFCLRILGECTNRVTVLIKKPGTSVYFVKKIPFSHPEQKHINFSRGGSPPIPNLS